MDVKKFIDEKEAAQLLGVPVIRLRKWRGDPRYKNKETPPFYKMYGRSVRYDRKELLKWQAKNIIKRKK